MEAEADAEEVDVEEMPPPAELRPNADAELKASGVWLLEIEGVTVHDLPLRVS